MRRIARPSRAIDASTSLHLSTEQRLLSPCHTVIAPCTHLRTAAAAFSTSPSPAFLLPAAKQDKRKHQQFVKRWQKRILGDSEPIGAHVDPYDPTSPVRIAPEEQGDYEEVLEEDSGANGASLTSRRLAYVPVEELGWERPGAGLLKVGGEEWQKLRREKELAAEFEKLTMRTYTPLRLEMASEIEDLTGTMYTLRDENLKVAQMVHEVTDRPYTNYNFGLRMKTSNPEKIRRCVGQAVVEILTLKEAGLDMDMAKLPNRGIYSREPWVDDIKLRRTDSGELALAFPAPRTADDLIKLMQEVPVWEPTEGAAEDELVDAAEEDVSVDEAADLLSPVLSPVPVPMMDPATPAFKRAAVVKIDPDKKPFDFMSNRPVPRTTPTEAPVEEVLEVIEPTLEPQPVVSPLVGITSALETSRSTVSELRLAVLEHRAQRLSNAIATLRRITRESDPSSPLSKAEEVKWRQVPITDLALKFALYKRLFQLTGRRIPDPQLTSSDTLGDLYICLCAAAKPQPTSLHKAIYLEGENTLRGRAKTLKQHAEHRAPFQPSPRRKADLGDLIKLGNVSLLPKKPNDNELRTKTGMKKVIDFALLERGLNRKSNRSSPRTRDLYDSHRPDAAMLRRTRTPQFGKVVPNKAARLLAKKTTEYMEFAEEREAERSMKDT